MPTPGHKPTELEDRIGALADQIIAEGKTGYNWSKVDDLLRTKLGLMGTSRCKRAKKSGRAANVLTESNDKDIALYLVFVQPSYTIEQFKKVARNRMARFPNVRAVAIADRVDETWRIRSYLEREGEGIAIKLRELKNCFPLLREPGAIEYLPVFNDSNERGPVVVSIDESDFGDKIEALAPQVPPDFTLLEEFENAVERQALTVSRSMAADLLACCLSGQLVFLAGPSGTGKSRLARCAAEFFAPEENRYVLEARRQLLGPDDVAGYFSNIAERYAVGSATVGLIELHEAVMSSVGTPRVPFMVIEEANLSPVEGYLAPIIHGLGAPSSPGVPWRLHSGPVPIDDEELSLAIPPTAFLGPFPRFLATINVDASAMAPARKVVSRALVVLLEPEEIDGDSFIDGIVAEGVVATGVPDGASWIGDPAATARASERTDIEKQVEQYVQFMRDSVPRNPLVPSYRDLKRAIYYMSNFAALLSGCPENYEVELVQRVAAENAFLHVTLPALGPGDFSRTVEHLANSSSLTEEDPGGLLRPRITRLRDAIDSSLFSDVVDFWTALS